MKITIICSSANHPINAWLDRWASDNSEKNNIQIVRNKIEAKGGDILFVVSCSEIISAGIRSKYKKTLVMHASDLPKGRGWSPHIWKILEGAQEITLSLLEADDKVDSGKIIRKLTIPVKKTALYDEINKLLFDAELQMMDYAVSNFTLLRSVEQDKNIYPTYYKKRTPEDSRIDPFRTIAEQFDLIRICDPVRFPAFFEMHGCRYRLKVERY